MTRAFKAIFAIIILVLNFAPVAAGPFEDAAAAFESGDDASALRILRPMANGGDSQAQTYLGSLYENSKGSQNYAEAVKWYRLAADQGHAFAQYRLGTKYEGPSAPEVKRAAGFSSVSAVGNWGNSTLGGILPSHNPA